MFYRDNHAFLLCESKFCNINETINDILINFVCNHKYDGDCLYCKKITSDNYYDCIRLNSNYDDINKENILNIINTFSKASNESAGYKFYIIRYIEGLNFSCLNSLLKFLENPPEKTIAIFTTKNENSVFPTIKSRCQNFRILTDVNKLNTFLDENNIKYKDLYKNIFFSYDEIINFEKNINRDFIINFIVNFHNLINNYSLIFENINLFNKLSYYEINLILEGLAFSLEKKFKPSILKIINDLNYKPNKNLIFNKIINFT